MQQTLFSVVITAKKQTIVNVMGQRFTSSIMCNLKKFNINVLSHNQIKANTSIALKSSIEFLISTPCS